LPQSFPGSPHQTIWQPSGRSFAYWIECNSSRVVLSSSAPRLNPLRFARETPDTPTYRATDSIKPNREASDP